MTERLKSALNDNIGHGITFASALCVIFIAWGKMDARQEGTERRVGELEKGYPEVSKGLARLEGKIDVLLMPQNQRSVFTNK